METRFENIVGKLPKRQKFGLETTNSLASKTGSKNGSSYEPFSDWLLNLVSDWLLNLNSDWIIIFRNYCY